MRENIIIKSEAEIKLMQEGGKKLPRVKHALKVAVKPGITAMEIEILANKSIEAEGGEASFKKVEGYKWATCININDGIVHGIPGKDLVFKKGDLVSVDVGMYYKKFHTDTSFSVSLSSDPEINDFLKVGLNALKKAIAKARSGNRIWDISAEMEKTLEAAKLTPIKALVGHGVGRDLHESPQIPCFTDGWERESSLEIPIGAVLAIEAMYAKGGSELKVAADGWTISTSDGKISGLFEETVAVTKNGPLVLTD